MKSDEEKVKFATSAALIDGRGKINYADLITELNKEFSNTEYRLVEGDDTTKEWTIQITKNAVNYKITSKGSAEQTINKIIAMVPEDEQPTIKNQISENMTAVVVQKLIRTVD